MSSTVNVAALRHALLTERLFHNPIINSEFNINDPRYDTRGAFVKGFRSQIVRAFDAMEEMYGLARAGNPQAAKIKDQLVRTISDGVAMLGQTLNDQTLTEDNLQEVLRGFTNAIQELVVAAMSGDAHEVAPFEDRMPGEGEGMAQHDDTDDGGVARKDSDQIVSANFKVVTQ